MTSIPPVAHAMVAVLTSTAQTCARVPGFVQRASKRDGARFGHPMVFGSLATPDAALADVIQTPRWAYPDRSLPTAARLIQKPARHVASAIGTTTAVETALDVSTRGVAACCRRPRRKTHPHTYPLLRDTRIYG